MQLVRRPGSSIRTAAHNLSAYYIDTFGKCRVSIVLFCNDSAGLLSAMLSPLRSRAIRHGEANELTVSSCSR